MKPFSLTFILSFIALNCFSQALSISSQYPLKIYQWIENPLNIVVENNSCEELIVKSNVGEISGENCNYIYVLKDTSLSSVKISVGIKKDTTISWIDEIDFPVKPIPTPEVQFSISRDGKCLSRGELIAAPTLSIRDYSSERIQRIIGYSLKILRNDSIVHQIIDIVGNKLPEETIDFIRQECKGNEVIVVENIMIMLYHKEKRKVEGNIKTTICSID